MNDHETRAYDAMTAELKVLTAFGRVAVARAACDSVALYSSRARLWADADYLCRISRGESMTSVLRLPHNVVSSSPPLVLAVNYFAALHGSTVRARETPLAQISQVSTGNPVSLSPAISTT